MRFLTFPFLIVALIGTSSSCPAQGIAPRRYFDYSITIRHSIESRPAVILPADNVLPAYPGEMLRAGMNGRATVKLLIHEDGSVSDIRVEATAKEFAGPTQRAVASWKFHPPRDLEPRTALPVPLTCVITFDIRDD